MSRRTLAALAQTALSVAFLAAFAIVALTQQAPAAGWVGTDSQQEATAAARWWDNEPEFADVAAGYSGCVSMEKWNRSVAGLAEGDLDRIPPFSVTIHLDGTSHRESTDVAWEKAEALPGGTYWIVGGCAA